MVAPWGNRFSTMQHLRHSAIIQLFPKKLAGSPVLPRPPSSRPHHPNLHNFRIIQARRRSTKRATDQVPPPRDPFSQTRRRSSSWPGEDEAYENRSASSKRKEPFEAELLILFGLPTLIILIPWAVKDPAAIAVIPLAFLIPGVRDVLLAVLRSTFSGVRKAKKFMREDRYAGLGGRSRPPPPPPPPPPGVYDLSEEDFEVQPAPSQSAYTSTSTYANTSSMIDGVEEDMYSPSSSSSFSMTEEEEEVGEEMKQAKLQAQQQKPNRAKKRRWVSYSRKARIEEEETSTDDNDSTADIDEELQQMQILERRRQRREARLARRQQLRLGLDNGASNNSSNGDVNANTSPVVVNLGREQNQSLGRIRSRSQASFFIDEEEDYEEWMRRGGPTRRGVPWYLRPLTALFPWLKDWGGFI